MNKLIIIILFALYNNLNAQSITFQDKNLKKALIELGFDENKNSQIEHDEIINVEKLNVSNRNIKSLADIIHFKNLKELNVMTNQISDIKVLWGNTVLEELYIGENKLGPELVIKDMPNLRGLYAFRNGILNFKFLSELPNLKSLYIQGNPVVNLNLENVINLQSLQLFECDDLKTIDINKNTKIKNFFIVDMKITNIVSKNDTIKTVYLESSIDAKNPSEIENIKIAPTIKVK